MNLAQLQQDWETVCKKTGTSSNPSRVTNYVMNRLKLEKKSGK